MTISPGPESPSAKKGDGETTVSRTIRTPLASMHITGSLTEVDRIYRLTLKSLLQNGYSSTHLTKTDAPPGNDEPRMSRDEEMDRLVDQSMEIIEENRGLKDIQDSLDEKILSLERQKMVLEDMVSRLSS